MVDKLSGIITFLLTYFAFSITSWIFPMDRKWLESLDKPAWSPPGSVIGLAWVVIFGLISLAVALLQEKIGWRRLGGLWKGVFIANYLFNQLFIIGQSFSRNLLLSFLDTAAIAVTAFVLVFVTWSYSRLASILFIPYALWSGFATFLSYAIYRLNR
ncbi:tryptophan-rich sensory protein [Heliobacterium chlorum]|uniref:Tryptophan-rich sensory protein n=1 Tax=Heliobacterium chlorum TaxID=2698 RepID=A0ABR7T2E0_HELCL|nr:tryptophan-rich sensory protein [Heliobacterium chlorum]MBC9783711.1 tryptophan-rich sensory protein [Heliobacterium chlorum]